MSKTFGDVVNRNPPQRQVGAEAADTVPYPVCPYCGTDPALLASRAIQLNPVVTAITFFCANLACRKVLSVHIVDIAQPRIETPNGGGIIRPS